MAGPVDGIFYRGAWHFGSAPDSRRIAHIRHDAAGERHATCHRRSSRSRSTAVPRSSTSAAREQAGFRRTLLDIYVPRYGPDWEAFLDGGPVYARIDAERMFTFFMPADRCARARAD